MTDDPDDLSSVFSAAARMAPDYSAFKSELFRTNGEQQLVMAIRMLRQGEPVAVVREKLGMGFPALGAPPLAEMDDPAQKRPILILNLLHDAEAIPDEDLNRMLSLALERA